MNERWLRTNDLFHAALEREPGARAAFLAQACSGDEGLRREVESLLASHDPSESFIKSLAPDLAAGLLAESQARLATGQSVGNYKVMALLGAGGMGEVYLTEDTRLGRRVALKLLPAQFTKEPDRLRRFQREARAASSLNHPNIITIHEVGQLGDAPFIITEFIEGKTLRQQMAAAKLRLPEALDAAIQVASALEAAHKAGIVHRDIKPENIMLRPDGLVKVLDFGLAKLTESQPPGPGAEATTLVGFQTKTGLVMGTVTYMSPEQARGLTVDARSDIFSLGAVIYEMIAGRVAFEGATNSDVIVSILEREPAPLSRFAPEVPDELERIVKKALAKDREERYQRAKDLLVDLRNLKQKMERQAPAKGKKDVQLHAEPTNWRRVFWATGIVGTALLLAGSALYWLWFSKAADEPQFFLTTVPLTTDPGYEGMPSLSPDGSNVAFVSAGTQKDNFDIYVKQIGGGPPLRLTSDPGVDEFPAWSPDGRTIAFIRERGDRDQEVLLIPALGGPERKLAQIAPDLPAELSLDPPYLSWSPDSKYLMTVDRSSRGEPPGLFVLSVATGEKRRLITPSAPALADVNPALSPDGRTLAFVRMISTGNTQLYVLPLSDDCRPTGEARRLDLPQPWVQSPTWTTDGQEIVCSAGPPWIGGMLWRVSISNSEKPMYLAPLGQRSYQPTVSRQGNRLVYQVRNQQMDIWRGELSGRGRSRASEKLIASTRWEILPQYSPDGSRIAFQSDRSGIVAIWMCNADGSNPVQLTSLEPSSGSPNWFPDGRRMVFDAQTEGQTEIYVIDADTRVARRLTSDPSADVKPSVSHDGKWIYFASTRTGRWEVWRMPGEGGEAVQVTHEGGFTPLESPDGKEVYYQKTNGDSDLWKVPVVGGEETRVLGPAGAFEFAVVADGIYFFEPGSHGYGGWINGKSLKFFSFAKGIAEKVFDTEYWPEDGLDVSPDERFVLFSQMDPFVHDLLLVENFR